MNELKRLKPLMKSFTQDGPAGCAIEVRRDGQVIYEGYKGYADIETNRKICSDTIYRMYSNTKIVTAVAALMLYERGLYLLDDPLEEYLPEFKNPMVYRNDAKKGIYTSLAKRSIKIKDLFTMSSGLTYPDDDNETGRQLGIVIRELKQRDEKYDTREFSKKIAKIPLAFDPGKHWHYAMSFEILGALIEVISGMKLSEFLSKEIFKPLDMNDTFFRIPEDKKERLCSYYKYQEGKKLEKLIDRDAFYDNDATMEEGGAGLLSTLADYGRFLHTLALGEYKGKRLLSSNTLKLMASNHLSLTQLKEFGIGYLSGYGYGLGVRTLINGPQGGASSSVGEYGWSGYAGTWALIDPVKGLSVVYAQQMEPNLQEIYQPRLRNVIYGAID